VNHGLFVRPDKLQKDESVDDDSKVKSYRHLVNLLKKPKTPKAPKATKLSTTKKIATTPMKASKISTTPVKPTTIKIPSKESLLSPKVEKKLKPKDPKKATTGTKKDGTEKKKPTKVLKSNSVDKLKDLDEQPLRVINLSYQFNLPRNPH
jgi:hypothetical protein